MSIMNDVKNHPDLYPMAGYIEDVLTRSLRDYVLDRIEAIETAERRIEVYQDNPRVLDSAMSERDNHKRLLSASFTLSHSLLGLNNTLVSQAIEAAMVERIREQGEKDLRQQARGRISRASKGVEAT